MINFKGIKDTEKIYESSKNIIYRGFSEKLNKSVIVKTTKSSNPSLKEIEYLRHEYELNKIIDDYSYIVKIFDLIDNRNAVCLIMEDFNGISLKDSAAINKFSIQEFLNIAISITDALKVIHSKNIIHKDIKPSNIIVNLEKNILKMIDFSISVIFSEKDFSYEVEQIEGSVNYISPEQTGLMNRSVDYRTDFYSLGCTFYELLSGKPPFWKGDQMEIFYSHIAKDPIPLSTYDRDIPEGLAAIVMKLLSKNPEERYRSALGLKADLEICLAEYSKDRNISLFKLGLADKSDNFILTKKLFGIKKHLSVLSEKYSKALRGEISIVFVCGENGTGKSSLLKEFSKNLLTMNGIIAEGAFFESEKNTPLSGIIKIFKNIIKQILTESSNRLFLWKDEILDRIGGNGQIIIDVIPDLELIIGKQQPSTVLGLLESINRFDSTFLNFIKSFAKKDDPLILIIDDFQFADSTSVKILTSLLADDEFQSACIVMSYNKETLSPEQNEFIKFLQHSVNVDTIELHNLNEKCVRKLLCDSANFNKKSTDVLTGYIVSKTNGNPLHTVQLITGLYRKNIIYYQSDFSQWDLHIDLLNKLEIDFRSDEQLISKINNLTERVRDILKTASCIGNSFNLNVISIISGNAKDDIFNLLKEACSAGIITIVDDSRMSSDQNDMYNVFYRFNRETFRKFIYSQTDDSQKMNIHLNTARYLQDSESSDKVFEKADHYNKAIDILTVDDIDHAVFLNMSAGKKAKSSTAYSQAAEYFLYGISLLGSGSWTTNYDLTYSFFRELSESEYLSGNYPKAMSLFDDLMMNTRSRQDKAEIYLLRVALSANISNFVDAVKIGLEALSMLDVVIDVNTESLQKSIAEEMKTLKMNLSGKTMDEIFNLPVISNDIENLKMKIFMEMSASVYFTNQTLLALVALKMINISLTYGNSNVSSYAYAIYGLLLCGKFGQYSDGYAFGKLALSLNEKFANRLLDCKINFMFSCFINHWRDHLKSDMDYLDRSYLAGVEYGDFNFGSYAVSVRNQYKAILGIWTLPELLIDCDKSIAFLKKVKNYAWLERQYITRAMILNLMGKTKDKTTFDTDTYNESQKLNFMKEKNFGSGISYYYIIKMRILYTYGLFNDAYLMSLESEKFLPFLAGSFSVSEHYFYQSLSAAALLDNAIGEERTKLLECANRNLKIFEGYKNNCEENFLSKFYLISAELASRISDYVNPEDFYEKAIDYSEKSGYPIIEALSYELCAIHFIKNGKNRAAQFYLTEALYIYRKWGAESKINDILEKYKSVLENNLSGGIRFQYDLINATTTASGRDLPDMLSVFKASQIITGEIVVSRLIDKMMRILMESAGAQKGFLLIDKNGILKVEAVSVSKKNEIITDIKSANYEQYDDMPHSVINYVLRKKESVVIHDASADKLTTHDEYIKREGVLSVLCLPVVEQNRAIALIYLENSLMKNVFTTKRIEFFNLLSSQIAVSLKNALNFEEITLTKDALDESRQRFKTIFDSVNDAIFIHDADSGEIIDVNNRMSEMYGYTKEEAVKLNVQSISAGYSPFTQDDAAKYMVKALNGEPQLFEWLAKHKNGNCFWVEVNMSTAEIGSDRNLIVVVRDITERKEAFENEQAHLLYLESIDSVSQIVSSSISVNEMMTKTVDACLSIFNCDVAMFGYPCSSSEPSLAITTISRENINDRRIESKNINIDEPLKELLSCMTDNRKPLIFESNVLFSSNLSDDISKTSIMIPVIPKIGKPWLFAVMKNFDGSTWNKHDTDLFHDISLRITDSLTNLLLFDNLKKSEEQYRNLFNDLQDVFYRSDTNGNVVLISPSIKKVFGYDPEYVLGKNIADNLYMRPDERKGLFQKLQNNNGSVDDFVVELKKQDGSGIWVSTNSHYYYNESGQMAGVEGVLRDITENKINEELIIKMNEDLENRVTERTSQLTEANDRLQLAYNDLKKAQNQLIQTEKMAALGGLVAGIAHEINTPIGISVTASSYLDKQFSIITQLYDVGGIKKSDMEAFLKTASESVSIIISNVNRASDLIRSFKQVAVDQSVELKRTFEVKEYIEEVILSLRPKLKKTQHKIHIVCDDDLVIDSFPGDLSQIISNLVINSLIHAYDEGQYGNIRIEVEKTGGNFKLVYSDDGKGIPPEFQRKVFEPFFTTNRNKGGTGLGLHILYNLITQKLGGSISLESALGKGVTFTMLIPL